MCTCVCYVCYQKNKFKITLYMYIPIRRQVISIYFSHIRIQLHSLTYHTNICNIILTHWGPETYTCVSKLIIIGSDNELSPAPSHLNHCWKIVNPNLRNKFQWNLNGNSYIFIQENAFENVVCEMAAIWPQRVKPTHAIWATAFQFRDNNMPPLQNWNHSSLMAV